MRCRWVISAAIAGAWAFGTAFAQPAGQAAGDQAAAADTSKLSVKLETLQNGVPTAIFGKDSPVEVIATVRVNMPNLSIANVQLALDVAEDVDLENPESATISALSVDNGGGGGYALQASAAPRARLRFVAPEGKTGLSGTQMAKWTIAFRAVASRAPFSVTAAMMVPPNPQIIAQRRDEVRINVQSVLSVKELWVDGGIFMWPLGACLVLGIAFALERLWTLSWAKINAEKFFDRISAAIREDGNVNRAVEICDKTRGPVASVMREGLLRVHQGIDHVERAISSAGAVQASIMQRGIIVMASVTTIAPFFGFLGTVWGMIIAFKAIAEAGDVKPTIVANGISQALITTVAGLIIAIMAQSFHNIVISRINRIVIDMEETSTLLVDLLLEEKLDRQDAKQVAETAKA